MKLSNEQKQLLSELIGDGNVGILVACLPIVVWLTGRFNRYFAKRSDLNKVKAERDEYRQRCERLELAYRPILDELSDLKNEQLLRDIRR